MGTTDETRAVAFAITADDFVAVSDFVFMRHLKRWRFMLVRRIFLVAIVLCGAVVGFARWEMGEPPIQWEDFGFDNSGILFVLLFVVLFPHMPRWIARWRFRSAGYAKIRAPRRIEISPDGLRSIDGISDSLTPWPSFIEIAVTPAAAYLFILQGSAHIVPRHAFADAAAFDAFVAAAQRYWDANRLAAPPR